jgi:hypothetical protein
MGRKIIQIAANAEGVFSLCDDGSVFVLSRGNWRRIPAIPQGNETAEHGWIQEKIGDLSIQLDLSPAERAALETQLLNRSPKRTLQT